MVCDDVVIHVPFSVNDNIMSINPAHARTRFRQARELLEPILTFTAPADQIIERYFKSHKQMGSKDRAFAAETVYGVLRHWRELQAQARLIAGDQHTDLDQIIALYLLGKGGWSARALQAADWPGDADQLVQQLRSLDKTALTTAERLNLSDDSYQRLRAQMSEAELQQLAQALNQPAPVDMRVNTQRSDREKVATQLAAEGYDCTPTPLSPLGLRRAQRGPLFNTSVFKQGHIEIQDEGSQLIGLLVQAKPRQKIVDFCAGAGGKTLLLAAQMRNRGEIIACDITEKRLSNMKPRLIRGGVDNVRTLLLQPEDETNLQPLFGHCDAVLVDAPCSGSGTWRRNPDMKWRDMDVMGLQQQQLAILLSASRLCKPGGRLVYATCSLFAAENQQVVQQFLQQQPTFTLRSAAEILTQEGVANAHQLVDENGMMTLLPHRHQTDGFFAAVMQKVDSN